MSSARRGGRLLTSEQHEWLTQHLAGRSRVELCAMISDAFGVRLTEKQMNGYLKNHKLATGRDMRFLPGTVSNRPPKGVHYSRATEFKAGSRPVNWRPVGSERVNVDGYVEIKTAEPRTWRAKHVVVWEQVKGPVPKGSVVIFADGDKLNMSPDNLISVTKHTLLVMNRLRLISPDSRLTHQGAAVGSLIAEIENRQKKTGRIVQTRAGLRKVSP